MTDHHKKINILQDEKAVLALALEELINDYHENLNCLNEMRELDGMKSVVPDQSALNAMFLVLCFKRQKMNIVMHGEQSNG